MRTQDELIRTLRRRVDFLKTRDHRNSYDQAELGALEWALVNLPPPQRTWVGLTEAQCGVLWKTNMTPFEYYQAIEAKLRSKNESKN